MNINTDTPLNPLAELKNFLGDMLERFTAKDLHAPAMRVGVATDILADVEIDQEHERAEVATRAASAEHADRAAMARVESARHLLNRVTVDGVVDDSDKPAILQAIAELNAALPLVQSSAALDRSIGLHAGRAQG